MTGRCFDLEVDGVTVRIQGDAPDSEREADAIRSLVRAAIAHGAAEDERAAFVETIHARAEHLTVPGIPEGTYLALDGRSRLRRTLAEIDAEPYASEVDRVLDRARAVRDGRDLGGDIWEPSDEDDDA